MADRPQRSPLLRRLAVRLLARRRGEVRALSDLLQLRGLLQFVGIFAFTIIAPGLILAYFGWTSIRGEELSVRAELQSRADSVTESLFDQTEGLFGAFERRVRGRLESGRSPVESLPELSPALKVAFRLDASGALAAPFLPPAPEAVQDQSFFLSSPWRDAQLAEQSGGDARRAAALYARAAASARGLAHRGQAEYARARALMKAGDTEAAKVLFADVVANYGAARHAMGFRLRDLALLKRGEILLSQDPVVGAAALEDLVDDLLSRRWTIGDSLEYIVASRALERLEEVSAKDWLASSRGRLEGKSSQAFWAELLVGDLDVLTAGGARLKVSPGEFSYQRVGETLWASTWWGEDFYAFALSLEALTDRLGGFVRQTAATDTSLEIQVLSPEAPSPPDLLSRRGLAPWLAGWSLAVRPLDAEAVAALQARKRSQRLAVIGLSVFMITTGAILASWLVSRELDVARMKADFAANVSHELRSPITQIRLKGESLMLGLAGDEEGRRRHYEAIVRESERLSRLVDNVLDFAAIERGAKKYSFRPVDIGETVRSAVEAARYSMEARELTIDLALSESLPVVFHDPEAVSQVLHNLISNAAKYGHEGGWIGVSGDLEAGGVAIRVADRGIGISPEDLPRIFEEYYRSSDPEARRRKGTGIGLTIVDYIMRAHGGGVSVCSEPGQGTTFTLHFPLKPPDPPAA